MVNLNSVICDFIGNLLRIAEDSPDLAGRRKQTLLVLGELTGTEFGYWSCGSGHSNGEAASPVTKFEIGISPRKSRTRFEAVFDERVSHLVRRGSKSIPGDCRMYLSRQSQSMGEEWKTDSWHLLLRKLGCDEWIQSISYGENDNWSQLFLARKIGATGYDKEARSLVETAMRSVPWVRPPIGGTILPDRFQVLTSRQRSVMRMILDGHTRKAIAVILNISEFTVNDHIKAIYRRFGVNSATELAAIFLRGNA